jgi:hypothetical protein
MRTKDETKERLAIRDCEPLKIKLLGKASVAMITASDLAVRFGLKRTGRDWRDITPHDRRCVPIANRTANHAAQVAPIVTAGRPSRDHAS